MPYTSYNKQLLVQFITGDDKPPSRTGPQLVALFITFGARDIYRDGLPEHPRRGRAMSRKEYVLERLDLLTDDQINAMLTKVINDSDNSGTAAQEIHELITEDGFSVVNNDTTYSVIGGIINRNPPVINQAHFQNIQTQILNALNNAQVSITLVIAWFTNQILRDKLIEKQNQGLDVKIAFYDDGINNRHGVDLTAFNVLPIRRGQRGGLMHDKFCVIDNQIVITGSYNWTDNAEFRNDENITIEHDPAQATRYTLEFRRLSSARR
jgi:HKD family nuclease